MKINKKLNLPRIIALVAVAALIVLGIIIFSKKRNKIVSAKVLSAQTAEIIVTPTETPEATPTAILTPTLAPTPTATVSVSLEDMNQNFGPCVKVNVLMYHHIQAEEAAKADGQSGLSVDPKFLREHLQYLKDHNYTVIEMKDLIGFFNGTEKLSGKLAMITLDDAYGDNYTNAYPLFKEFGVKATIFTPTGLVNNPDYLTWDEINQMKDNVYFANHTWSHHSQSGTNEVIEKEISMADSQLRDKGLNSQKVFAYPYGSTSPDEINILKKYGYNLAFTTKHGNIMCKGKSLELPRIRVGNAPLNKYGL